MLQFLGQHKEEVLVGGVLCSDHLTRAAQVLVKRKDEIMVRLKVLTSPVETGIPGCKVDPS